MSEVIVEPAKVVKKARHSKMVWTNIISFVLIYIQNHFGYVILTPEEQVQFLSLLNLVFRFTSDTGIEGL